MGEAVLTNRLETERDWKDVFSGVHTFYVYVFARVNGTADIMLRNHSCDM